MAPITRRRIPTSQPQPVEHLGPSTAPPRHGFRFPHGSAAIDRGAVQRWLGGLSSAERRALAHPRTIITTTVGANEQRSDDANARLARQRGAAAKALLREIGFRGEVRVVERTSAQPTATFDIYSGEQRFFDFIERAGRAARAYHAAHPSPVAGTPRAWAKPLDRLPFRVAHEIRQRLIDGTLSDRQASRVGDHLVLPHPISGALRGIALSDLPAGITKQNGNLVCRTSTAIEVFARLPQTDGEVRAVAARRGVDIDATTVRRLADTGRRLNDGLRRLLKRSGKQLSDARLDQLKAIRQQFRYAVAKFHL